MTQTSAIDSGLDAGVRDHILSAPETLLEDSQIMQALVSAGDRAMGGNIVDLRGIAMERLEARLDRLEDTHRSVIAAAYENLAGTNQIHRAVLKVLDATDFEGFLHDLGHEVAAILRIDAMRLVLESEDEGGDVLDRVGDVLAIARPGFIEGYLTRGRSVPVRQVTLRQTGEAEAAIYGASADLVRSEACLLLDFGAGRQPGLLLMGSQDPAQFAPQQGTDLLAFFAGVFERAMRRWLA